jgi:hypothetical protein
MSPAEWAQLGLLWLAPNAVSLGIMAFSALASAGITPFFLAIVRDW